jgi:hypothetical protein
VVVASRGEEGQPDTDGIRTLHRDVEAEDVVVEVRGAPKVGDSQMDVANADRRMYRFAHVILLSPTGYNALFVRHTHNDSGGNGEQQVCNGFSHRIVHTTGCGQQPRNAADCRIVCCRGGDEELWNRTRRRTGR